MANELFGEISSVTGSITGYLRPFCHFDGEIEGLRGSFVSDCIFQGEIESVEGAFSGSVGETCNLDGTIQSITGAFCSGNHFSAEITTVTGTFSASIIQHGNFYSSIQRVTGSFSTGNNLNGDLDGGIRRVTGYFNSLHTGIVATLDGDITRPSSDFAGFSGAVCEFDIQLRKPKGSFSARYRYNDHLDGSIEPVLGEFATNLFADHSILVHSRGTVQ